LTVLSGVGSGNYVAGSIVLITANLPPVGQVFDKWTSSGGGSFANVNSITTEFKMPTGNVTVTPTYKDDVPDATESITKEELFVWRGKDAIHIKSTVYVTVYVYSISGQFVEKILDYVGEKTINVPKGIYVVVAEVKSSTKVFKIAVP
jgi:hypothetical protein